jgi:F-type H+-transporting ATPase subunit a
LLTHKVLLTAAFLPAGTPILLTWFMVILEVIAYLTRTISLGLRLAVNMLTGHVLCKVVLGFVYEAFLSGTTLLILAIPLSFLVAFLSLEI